MGLFARLKSNDFGKRDKSATGALSPSESVASLRSTLSEGSCGAETQSKQARWQKMPPPSSPMVEPKVKDIQAEHMGQQGNVAAAVETRLLKGGWTKRKDTPRPKTMDRLTKGTQGEGPQHLQAAHGEGASRQNDCSLSFNAMSHQNTPSRVASSPQRSATSFTNTYSSSLDPTPETPATDKADEMEEMLASSGSRSRNETSAERRRTFIGVADTSSAATDEEEKLFVPLEPATPTTSKPGQALRQAGNRIRSGLRRASERPKTADDSRSQPFQRDLKPLCTTSDSFPRRRKNSVTSLRTAVSMNVLNGQSAATSSAQAAGDTFGSPEAMANALKTLTALHRRQASVSQGSETHNAPNRPRAFTLETPKGRRTSSVSAHAGKTPSDEDVPRVPTRPKTATQQGTVDSNGSSLRSPQQDEQTSAPGSVKGCSRMSSESTEDGGTPMTRRSGESWSKDNHTVRSSRSTSETDPLCLDLFLQLGPAPPGLPEDDLAGRAGLVRRFIESAALARTQRHKGRIDDDSPPCSPLRADLDYTMRGLETELSAWMRARIVDDREAMQACSLAAVLADARREMKLPPSSWRLHKLFDFSSEYGSAKMPTAPTSNFGLQQGWSTQYSLEMDAMAGLSKERTMEAGKASPPRLLMPVPRSRRRPATGTSVPSSSTAGAPSPLLAHRLHMLSADGLAPWPEDMGGINNSYGGGLCISEAKTSQHHQDTSGHQTSNSREIQACGTEYASTARFSPIDSASPTSMPPTTPPTMLSESVLQLYQNAAHMALSGTMYDKLVLFKQHDDHNQALQPRTAESWGGSPTRVVLPPAVEVVRKLKPHLSHADAMQYANELPLRKRSPSAATMSSTQADSFRSASSSPQRSRSPA